MYLQKRRPGYGAPLISSLILSKDARSPETVRRRRAGVFAHSLPGSPVALRSVPKNRPLRANVAQALLGGGGPGEGGEVLGHWPLKSIRPAQDWRRIWFKAVEATAPVLSISRLFGACRPTRWSQVARLPASGRRIAQTSLSRWTRRAQSRNATAGSPAIRNTSSATSCASPVSRGSQDKPCATRLCRATS